MDTMAVKERSMEKWQDFGRKVSEAGYILISECKFEPSAKGITDPRAMAYCVLARTISNLQAVLVLVKSNQIVEARTITRCCYENSFWIQGLLTSGDEFVREMRRDEAASMKSRVEFILAKMGDQLDDTEQVKGLRQRIIDDKKLRPKRLNLKEAAGRGPLGSFYDVYGQLSADAAHPSLTSLKRYFDKTYEDGQTVYTFTGVPEPKPEEAQLTLEWACCGTLSVYIGVNQLFQWTGASSVVEEAANEFAGMAGLT
jgi:hypothetical protein